MNDRSKHLWLKVMRIALDVLVACMLVTAVFCSYLEHGLFKTEAYQTAVFDEQFDEYVEKEINESLGNLGSVVEIPRETVVNAVGMNRMVTYAHDYTNAFLEETISGKEVELEDFTSDALLGAVRTELERYAEEENVLVTEEDEAEITAYILKQINTTLHYIPGRLLTEVRNLAPKLEAIATLKGLEVPLYGASILLLLINFLLGGRRHAWDVGFGSAAAAWCAFATVFLPLWMLHIYNVPSRIALSSESTLFCLLTGLCRMMISRPALLFGVIFVALTGLLVWVCLRKAKKKVNHKTRPRGFVRVHFSDEGAKTSGKTDFGEKSEKNT